MATDNDPIKITVHVHTRHRDLGVRVQDFLTEGFVTLELGELCFYFSSLEEIEQMEIGLEQVRDLLEAEPIVSVIRF